MDWFCETQVAQFISMTDFSVDSVTEIQHGLECAISKRLLENIVLKTEEQIDIRARKYGVSALLMGEMGYYNPSFIMEYLCKNVKRGRLLRKMPASPAFIYDFDQAGNLSRVINNDLHLTTYVVHHITTDICISVSNAEKDIVSIIICLKDDLGRTSKWIQFRWYCQMKVAYGMGAELYQYTDEENTCITFSGISDGHGILLGLARNKYRFEINPDGKISSLEYIE